MKQPAETSRKRPVLCGVRTYIAAALCVPVFIAAGCGLSNREDVSSLSVDENGRLTCTVMEPAQAGDTEETVRAFVQERIDAYAGNGTSVADAGAASDSRAGSAAAAASDENKEQRAEQTSDEEAESEGTEAGIQIERCEIRDNEISLALSYRNYSDYAAFNGTDCFFGTISEAEEAGYSLEGTLLDDNEAEADYATLQERAREWKVIIFEEPMNVRVPDKILYASENMKITGRLTASYIGDGNEKAKEEPAETGIAASGAASAFSASSGDTAADSDAAAGSSDMAAGSSNMAAGSADSSSDAAAASAGGDVQGSAEDDALAGVPQEVREFAVDDFEQIIIVFK